MSILVVSEITDFPYSADEGTRWGKNVCDVFSALRERSTRFSFPLLEREKADHDQGGYFELPRSDNTDESWLRDNEVFSRSAFEDSFFQVRCSRHEFGNVCINVYVEIRCRSAALDDGEKTDHVQSTSSFRCEITNVNHGSVTTK